MLLSIGVSPDALDSLEKRGPLHLAGSLERPEMIRLLLKKNANIEITDNSERTPLHYAASYNRTEAARLLLEHNANIEARNQNNRTPLHYAV